MAQFQYRAADAEGKVVEGTIEAPESALVVSRLQDRGLIPIRISQAGAAVPGVAGRLRLPAFQRKAGRRELVLITQELAALLGAGLPLDRCLATMCDLADHGEVKQIISDVLQSVRGGKQLADALGEHDLFPPLYVNMVRAGEVGGFLDASLQRLAEYLDSAEELRSDVVGALVYPIFLMGTLGLSMVFMLVFVLPRFASLFDEAGSALPLPTRMVLALSDGLRSYWWVAAVVAVVVWVVVRRSLATPAGRLQWDQTKLRMPAVGTILRKMGVARLARTLGTLLHSGVPMVQALTIVREVAGNEILARALDEVEVGVREGAGLANPLARSGAAPQLAIQMISVGEETGRLDEMLLKVADHYDREVRVQITRFTRLLEPIMILVMALLVGFVVISMLLGIFSVNDLAF
jgi:general secretion pathway protein F